MRISKSTKTDVRASTKSSKKTNLIKVLDKLSEYHSDIAPEQDDSVETLVEKFCYWVDEYNDGYLGQYDKPEDAFGKWLKKQYEACNSVEGSTNKTNNKYSEAQKHIKAAIDVLASSAKNDELAKDSIADLGYVMLNLNSSTVIKASKLTKEQKDKVWEIANNYTTSNPKSGDWDKETEAEQKEISKALGISMDEAKQVMIDELGFNKDMF